MTSPFRLTPPRRRSSGWLHRPRLLNVMAGRFQRRLTVIRGGAGFGKTTLLLQALEDNESEPRGIDCWLGLSPRDARPSELGAALRAAVDARPAGDVVDAVAEAIWKKSPSEIALILDDVHYVEPDTPAAELLAGLLRELPNNGHLVLVGRRTPPVPMTRLLASGEALEIDEEHLAFTATEQASFLSMRGAAGSTEQRAGWPALVELTATVGADRVESYLWEEVLDGLSPARRRGLARLAPLEWIDTERIAAFTATDETAESFLADLPLTSLEPNGAARLHALWEPVLGSIDPGWTDEDFTRAIDHLADRGHYREAVELSLHNGREDEITPLLTRLVQSDWQSMAPESLETLIATLPRSIATAGIGSLLKGLLVLHSDPVRAEPFIQAAQARFKEEGDEESYFVALALLSHLAFFRVDRDALVEIEKSAEGYGTQRGREGALPVRATIALVDCRPHDALALIDEARRIGATNRMRGGDSPIVAMCLIDLGWPERALDEVQAALPTASPFSTPALFGLQFDGAWFAGAITRTQLAALDDGVPGDAAGHAHQRAIALSTIAFMNATFGRVAVGTKLLGRAATLLERGLGEHVHMAYAVGKMALECCEGREAEAAKVIEAAFAAHDPERLTYRQTLRGAALAAVISPKLREQVSAWGDLGPCWRLVLDSAHALLAFREKGERVQAAALPWDAHRKFAMCLVPPMVLELGIAATLEGNADARRVVQELAVEHRDVLRRLAENDDDAVREEARGLLRSIPERPASQLELRVLGDLELLRDGEPVDDPAVRRERVRALLHFLAANGQARRDDLSAELWPELDAGAAANNLRVTLSHVRNLLEPDRDSGAPSFFLPQSGDVVSLRVGDGMELDVDRFGALIEKAEASDMTGDPAAALAHYEEAIALHRGEYLADAANSAWGDARRPVVRGRLVSALLRAAELRLGREELDDAVSYLERAQRAAPENQPVLRTHVLARERRDGHAAARHTIGEALESLTAASVEPDGETVRLAARFGVAPIAAVPRGEEADSGLGLSVREIEVLRLVDQGLSNREIAKTLFVAPSTVKTHLENVYDKLGVRRRTQAASVAREQGLLS